jgi:hypothetical protein
LEQNDKLVHCNIHTRTNERTYTCICTQISVFFSYCISDIFSGSPTNKTDRHDITEISLKEALTLTPILTCSCISSRDTNNKTMAYDQNNKLIKKIWGLMSAIFHFFTYFFPVSKFEMSIVCVLFCCH